MYFDSQILSAQENYQLLVGGVVPRPIAWVSTISAAGLTNLAPFSFFTVASCEPPVLVFTHVNPRDGRSKDTLNNLRATGECVVNVVSADLVDVMNASCGDYPPNVSEFTAVGIDDVASVLVAPPGVKQAKVRYECRLREINVISEQPMGGTLIFLDVVGVYMNEDVLSTNGNIDQQKIQATGKLGGDYYTGTAEPFLLARPNV